MEEGQRLRQFAIARAGGAPSVPENISSSPYGKDVRRAPMFNSRSYIRRSSAIVISIARETMGRSTE